MTLEIRLESVKDVQDFVSMATACHYPVAVDCGGFSVNGKSFMEMFCIDLRRRLTVTVDCGNDPCPDFCQAAARFQI